MLRWKNFIVDVCFMVLDVRIGCSIRTACGFDV
jgi:hypothetical protein